MELKGMATVAYQAIVLAYACYSAFQIRLFAVTNYGRVIHEFDPWFNYRATEFLVDNGWDKFKVWFDTMSWYPLGRHVGTTIYPGMQITAALMFKLLEYLGTGIPLNDVCVFMPAVFGTLATLACFFLAKETTGSANAGAASALIFAIIPAHLMRSVAGGYDNESVAVTAIVLTFYFWTRALRDDKSWLTYGFLTALAYIYMCLTWGGYTFVLNMIGLHVAMLIGLGRYTTKLHRAYSVFFFVATAVVMQIPIVGTKPIQDMEQVAPLLVFFGIQVLEFCEIMRRKHKMDERDFSTFRLKVIMVVVVFAGVFIQLVIPAGFFGPISNRVRSLFIKHTTTGNPLVDSVAEHQATRPDAYWLYFHNVFYYAPLGFATMFAHRTDSKWFIIAYTLMAAYFSRKMVRLILILGPAAAICAGRFAALAMEWSMLQVFAQDEAKEEGDDEDDKAETPSKDGTPQSKALKAEKSAKKAKRAEKNAKNSASLSVQVRYIKNLLIRTYNYNTLARKVVAVLAMVGMGASVYHFQNHCTSMAQNLSEPQIMLRGRNRDGSTVIIDDFRESYWWLRDNTPEDARVMAWWDYGYQITGVANRTTIADGNTWNHEHLALLGKCLVSGEEDAIKMIRHLADYMLVWSTRYAGMWGDDLAKVPHIARIAGSVYPDIHGQGYYMESQNKASPLLENSLLYRLHGYRLNPEIKALKHFDEVYTSKNLMVRIYKVKDVAKRTPHGDYAPYLKKNIISKSKPFDQNIGR
eukprot:CAMPEP_0198197216 /NCGR_PEP_ID=MMETSP1445-20131203/806_1 /TAXON_ID=36898 /ORGANISM="Pyramimonas sp., Strain CCMP2087" /LENGTH=749 /DNA_ID=CAMNT_0043866419 /DNA_START=119 /DNA_END=2368 /DNA_ORIENTATION=-